MDYFLARYYSSTQGRFISPDEPFADQDEEDPQSWNLYSYVINNPLKYDDPLGLWKRVKTDDGREIWEAEKGDTFSDLAEILGTSAKRVVNFFDGNANVEQGVAYDVTALVGQLDSESKTAWVTEVVTEADLASRAISIGFGGRGMGGLARGTLFRGIGKKAAETFGRTVFKGLVQNRPLRQLTHREIKEAFKETGYKLSNHAIKRLKDPRTEALGFKTLNDIKRVLNEGVVGPAGKGLIEIKQGAFKAIVNPVSKVIVTFSPD